MELYQYNQLKSELEALRNQCTIVYDYKDGKWIIPEHDELLNNLLRDIAELKSNIPKSESYPYHEKYRWLSNIKIRFFKK